MNWELEIAKEIRRVFCDTRWVITDLRSQGKVIHIEVDADTWADLAHRLGYGADWAISWIRQGYPSPPDWMYNGADAEEKHRGRKTSDRS